MASPSGSPRRGRTLILNGIPHDTHPAEVLERLQTLAGRLQRASTTRSSPSSLPSTSPLPMAHSLAAQQRQRQRQRQRPNEPAAIPGAPSPQRVYSVKVEFSTREAASKARELVIAQPHPGFGFSDDVEIVANFVLEEEDTLLDIPVILSSSQASLHPQPQTQPQPQPQATTTCGVCGGGDSSSAEETHSRRTSAEGILDTFDTTHLCVPPQYNTFSHNGNNGNIGNNGSNNGNNPNSPYQHADISSAFRTSASLSSGSSLAPSPHYPPSRLPHSSQGSYSTLSSASPRSSPGAPAPRASPPMDPGFSLLPFDSRDPFHPHHSQSAFQDGLLFDRSPGPRPKVPSALPALGGYGAPAYLTHSRSSSYGQTPTATTYQAREWGLPQRFHPSPACSSSSLVPLAPAPGAGADADADQADQADLDARIHQSQQPARVGSQQAPVSVPAHSLSHTPSLPDVLDPAKKPFNKLNFRAAALTATAARHLATHNRSQSMGVGVGAGVGCGVNRPAMAPPTTHPHAHARSASVVVVGSTPGAHSRPNGNTSNTSSNTSSTSSTSSKGPPGAHKRSKSSASAHSHTSSSTPSSAGASAEHQKTYAYDPHRGPRSTDWMLSPETLAARPHKDAKFAQMVALGLARGRTKAGWAQARRPGKRDRDAAKRKLAEEMGVGMAQAQAQAQAAGRVGGGDGGGDGVWLDAVVAGVREMAVADPHAA